MPEDRTDPGILVRLLSGSDLFTRGVQGLLALAGALALVDKQWRENAYLLALAISVMIAAGGWFAIGRYLQRRQPRSVVLSSEPRATSSYFRGLLPFDEGDRLLGRDIEVGQLLTLLRTLEFRFGFLSGEAGAGKTSMLRARILPELKKGAWQPVYVPRTGGDPIAAIRSQLLADKNADLSANGLGLVDLLRGYALPEKPTILIIDQFEEYFVSTSERSGRERFESELRALTQAGLPVRVLFALRKEFVDDLLDLATILPELDSARWRLPLRNFVPETAREILRTVVDEEHLRFSDDLQEQVVIDLSQDQRVRPVEFQLVLTTLLTQGVFDVSKYRDLGGAHGVISNFVRETIDPPDRKVGELERLVGQYTLRTLCNRDFTTRRPVGLSQSELSDRIHAEIRSSGHLPVGPTEIADALDRVRARLMEGYILLREDGERFNLAHDYLAPAVRDATASVETVEERATRLLDQYLLQARSDKRVILPWRTFRFVRRYANRETLARADALALLARSRMRHGLIAAGVAAAALILVTALLPFGVRHPISERIEVRGEIDLSADKSLLTLLKQDGVLDVIQLANARAFVPRGIDIKAEQVFPSPNGRLLLVIGKDGALYKASLDGKFSSEKLFDSLGWRKTWEDPVGFSDDGVWAFAALADGRIYVWPIKNDRPKNEVLRLSSLTDVFSDPIPVTITSGAAPSTIVADDDTPFPVPPPFGFVRESNVLWVVNGDGTLYLISSAGTRINFKEGPIKVKTDSDRPQIVSSSNGHWLAIGDSSGDIRIIDLINQSEPKLGTAVVLNNESQFPSSPYISISPDNNWMVVRAPLHDFFATKLERPIVAERFPAIDLDRSSSDGGLRTVSFDPSVKFAGGQAQDSLIYVWELGKPPGAQAAPAGPSERRVGFRDDSLNVAFCPDGSAVLVSGNDGSIYAARLDKWPLEFSQVGRLAAGDVRFRFGTDARTAFAFDSLGLVSGECGRGMARILESDSQIHDLAADGSGNLILIGRRSLTRFGRSFFLWGIPIWRLDWPSLAQAHDVR